MERAIIEEGVKKPAELPQVEHQAPDPKLAFLPNQSDSLDHPCGQKCASSRPLTWLPADVDKKIYISI